MSNNSFLIKGWSITLVSALFALAAKDANSNYVLITYVVIPAFWLLDGFFLYKERQYRYLYNQVKDMTEDNIDFSMDASGLGPSWGASTFSITLLLFYGISVIATFTVMFLLN